MLEAIPKSREEALCLQASGIGPEHVGQCFTSLTHSHLTWMLRSAHRHCSRLEGLLSHRQISFSSRIDSTILCISSVTCTMFLQNLIQQYHRYNLLNKIFCTCLYTPDQKYRTPKKKKEWRIVIPVNAKVCKPIVSRGKMENWPLFYYNLFTKIVEFKVKNETFCNDLDKKWIKQMFCLDSEHKKLRNITKWRIIKSDWGHIKAKDAHAHFLKNIYYLSYK